MTIHRSSCWPGFHAGCSPTTDDLVEVPVIMRALEPEVVDAIWATIQPLLPTPDDSHPLGPTVTFDADILFSSGVFVQWPAGVQRE